jgi:hypothetical protein
MFNATDILQRTASRSERHFGWWRYIDDMFSSKFSPKTNFYPCRQSQHCACQEVTVRNSSFLSEGDKNRFLKRCFYEFFFMKQSALFQLFNSKSFCNTLLSQTNGIDILLLHSEVKNRVVQLRHNSARKNKIIRS